MRTSPLATQVEAGRPYAIFTYFLLYFKLILVSNSVYLQFRVLYFTHSTGDGLST